MASRYYCICNENARENYYINVKTAYQELVHIKTSCRITFSLLLIHKTEQQNYYPQSVFGKVGVCYSAKSH